MTDAADHLIATIAETDRYLQSLVGPDTTPEQCNEAHVQLLAALRALHNVADVQLGARGREMKDRARDAILVMLGGFGLRSATKGGAR